MSEGPRVWVLLGKRRGDNNQLLALAEALRVPFETRTLFYKRRARLWMGLFPRSIGHLTGASRRWLGPPWPDVVIGIGRRSVPVALWIKKQSGGKARLVRLGHPRADNVFFDLVITTAQYPVRLATNVVTLPLAMNRFRKPPKPTPEEQQWLEAHPRPHLLLSLGGTAPMWRLDMNALRKAAEELAQRARRSGGTLIVVGSPRTPEHAWDAISESAAVVRGEVRYPVLLNDADEQFVTADSVSMISEAVLTGKSVGLIPVEADARGRRRLRGDPERTSIRDIRRFWQLVRSRGLVGTIDEPRRGEFEDPVETAAAAVRQTLSGLFD